ncbi:MAG: hypothetical protein GY703_01435 [Gammaproteobacteria bacterium]|nr:hypothetical protein [Gammaproteobacteria bacterium]
MLTDSRGVESKTNSLDFAPGIGLVSYSQRVAVDYPCVNTDWDTLRPFFV